MRKLKIFGIIITFLLVSFLALYLSESDKGLSDLRITNITSNSATISWTTEKETKGVVRFSEENSWPIFINRFTGQKAHDDRNLEYDEDNNVKYSKEIAKDRIFHHVTIGNLNPETEYFFRIAGKFKVFKADIESFKTLPLTDVVAVPDPAYGEIKNFMVEGENPKDGIVYFKIKNKDNDQDVSENYSVTIAENSTWSIDLASVRTTYGDIFNWNAENYELEAEFKSDIGYGWQNFELDEYKPMDHAIINIRYVTE
jgi:hypothetical protein